MANIFIRTVILYVLLVHTPYKVVSFAGIVKLVKVIGNVLWKVNVMYLVHTKNN